MVAPIITACDTSFLYSLYSRDVFTPLATQWVTDHPRTIYLTQFNEHELINAVAHSRFRKDISMEQSVAILTNYASDQTIGRTEFKRVNYGVVLQTATRLSRAHTAAHGFRAYDILHVAAALTMNASHFLTFDARQARLAGLEHLETNPLEKHRP